MSLKIRGSLAVAALAVSAVSLLAGGLFVVLGSPDAHPAAKAMGAALTFKLAGCDPDKATVSAAAIGIVKGVRKEVPLAYTRLDDGVFAVKSQWPKDGRWVVQLVARDSFRVSTTLVPVGPDGIERTAAKMEMKVPDAADIDAMLAAPAKASLAKR